MIAFATADWVWLVIGAWFGALVLFAVIVFLNWPEPDDEDEVTWEEFTNDDDREDTGWQT